MTAKDYAAFTDAGFIKVAWAVRVMPLDTPDRCRVTVEVRVQATDEPSWRKFRRYFLLIGPFSRYIRRSLLETIARDVSRNRWISRTERTGAMYSIPVFYATTEGHTQLIAEAIASTLREQGFDSEAQQLRSGLTSPDWSNAASAVVGGSLHGGRHQAAVRAFVARELVHLNRRPAAFFSVSLSAASRNPSEVQAAHNIAERFVQDLQWQPRRLVCVAGELAYRKYGFLKRWVMRRIASREGAPTDTSRNYDFTDWNSVKAFALEVAADARCRYPEQAAS
jgi:menaquinone-dependent protoporphyrinogen oxidase